MKPLRDILGELEATANQCLIHRVDLEDHDLKYKAWSAATLNRVHDELEGVVAVLRREGAEVL